MPVRIDGVPIIFMDGRGSGMNDAFSTDATIQSAEYVPVHCTASTGNREVGLARVKRTNYGMVADMVIYHEMVRSLQMFFPSFNGRLLARSPEGHISAASLEYIDLIEHHTDPKMHSLGNFAWKELPIPR